VIQLFTAAAASANTSVLSASERPTFLLLDVTVASAPVFTLKVNARAKGAGHAGAVGFTGFVSLYNVVSGAVIDGGTGITAAGNYLADVTGLEFQVEYVRSSGGNMTCAATFSNYPLSFSAPSLREFITLLGSGFGSVIDLTGHYEVNGVQVVTDRGAAVADATGGSVVDVEARAAINALLAEVRTHGLIAP